MISISSPRCFLLLSVLKKTYTLRIARFRLVSQFQYGHPWLDWSNDSLEDGGTVWEYRYTDVSSLCCCRSRKKTGASNTCCSFDLQKVLRYWLRKDCGQSLDLNSTSLLEHLGRIIEMGAQMARGRRLTTERGCVRLLRSDLRCDLRSKRDG